MNASFNQLSASVASMVDSINGSMNRVPPRPYTALLADYVSMRNMREQSDLDEQGVQLYDLCVEGLFTEANQNLRFHQN